jgi:hypothetical protein
VKLNEVDLDVLLAKGEPRPMFVVIRPVAASLTEELCETVRSQWQSLVDAHPEASLPPCIVVPKGWDFEAVYPPKTPEASA